MTLLVLSVLLGSYSHFGSVNNNVVGSQIRLQYLNQVTVYEHAVFIMMPSSAKLRIKKREPTRMRTIHICISAKCSDVFIQYISLVV